MNMIMDKQRVVMFMLSNINMPICYFEMDRCGEDDPIEHSNNQVVIAQFAATMPNDHMYNVEVRVDCVDPYIIINNIR